MTTHDYAQRPSDLADVELAPPVPAAAPARAADAATPVAGLATQAASSASSSGGDDPLGGTRPPEDVIDALRRRRGNGQPLPSATAERFGEQLGADLSAVRLHTDSEADSMSRAVGATAFTYGNDVYFTGGQGAAGASGERVLLHELAHVAQQQAGRAGSTASGGPVIGLAADPAEAEADQMADNALSALRRVAAQPQSGESTAEGPIRRLSVAELRAKHETFIRAAGGDTKSSAGGTATGGIVAKLRSKFEGGSENKDDTENGNVSDTNGDALNTADNESDNKTEGETGNTVENEVDGGSENKVEDETHGGTENELEGETDGGTENELEDETDGGTENKVEGETDNKLEGETEEGGPETTSESETTGSETGTDEAEKVSAPSPELLAKIALFAEAMGLLAQGSVASAAEQKGIRLAVLRLLAQDEWIEGMKILEYDDLQLFVKNRHDLLVEQTKPTTEGEGTADGSVEGALGGGEGTQSPGELGTEAGEPGEDGGYVPEAFKITYGGGHLLRGESGAEPGVVDTTTSETTSGPGAEIFYVGEYNELHIAPEDAVKNANVLDSAQTKIAGEITVVDGVITRMVSLEGREPPDAGEFQEFLRALQDAGVGMGFAVVGLAGEQHSTAQAILEAGAEEPEAKDETKTEPGTTES